MSRLIYTAATDVALNWIETSKVVIPSLRSVSNNLLKEYLQMNIKDTLQGYLIKYSKKQE